jgi:SnoaL-like protein
MHANEILIAHFYDAFSRRDAESMAHCYHHDAHFSDPVFELDGDEVPDMWRMLCSGSGSLKIEYSGIQADHNQGRAHWDAIYTFAGRKVHNRIDSRFEFRNGLILNQHDSFDFWRWSRQALGPMGWLLGWTDWLRLKVGDKAFARLAAFRHESER